MKKFIEQNFNEEMNTPDLGQHIDKDFSYIRILTIYLDILPVPLLLQQPDSH